jgi:hypothetical protein
VDIMKRYADLSGRSGVTFYGLLDDGSLVVMFRDESVYVYPFVLNKNAITSMLTLAERGRGLATYISRTRPLGARVALAYGYQVSGDGVQQNGRAT